MIIITILNYLFLSPLFVAPLLYKSKSRRMVIFYTRMRQSENCRKLFALIVVFIMLMFQLTYYWQHQCEWCVAVSAVIIIYMFSPTRSVGMLQGIRNNRYVNGLIFTMSLTALFIPHLYTLGVSLAYIHVTVMFYPSWKARSRQHLEKVYTDYKEMVDDTVSTYFR